MTTTRGEIATEGATTTAATTSGVMSAAGVTATTTGGTATAGATMSGTGGGGETTTRGAMAVVPAPCQATHRVVATRAARRERAAAHKRQRGLCNRRSHTSTGAWSSELAPPAMRVPSLSTTNTQ